MLRHTLTIGLAAFLAAVVGAQGPKQATAPQKSALFQRNRPVIETLVKETVQSSRNDHVKRAETYYEVLRLFSKEIGDANQKAEQARVDELTQHLVTLLDKGLAPTLSDARKQVEQGTGNEEYKKLKVDLILQLDALRVLLADNPAAKASLDGAKERVEGIKPVKK